MDETARRQVGEILARARIEHRQIERLAPEQRPTTDEDAQGIQDALIAAIGKPVGGWKVGAKRPIHGAMFSEVITTSPATLTARDCHFRGIEGEVAFVFPRGLPPRASDYTREEVCAAVEACAAIEIVDSRYRDFPNVSEHEKLADLLSNGGFVQGKALADWGHLDFRTIRVELEVDGKVVLERQGGHATGEPLHACTMFANAMRLRSGIPAGAVVTAGTYTGMPRLAAGSTAIVRFAGLGEAQLTFSP